MPKNNKELLAIIILAVVCLSIITIAQSQNSGILINPTEKVYLDFSQSPTLADARPENTYYDTSLIAYWNLDESSGGVVNDSSTNSYNGFVYGAASVPGKYNNALSFDGFGNYVDCGYIVPSNSMTFSAWFKTSSTQQGTILALDDYHRFISITNGNTIVYWWKTSMSEVCRYVKTPTDYLDGSFHFIVFTYDNVSGLATTYWDGSPVDSYFFGGNIPPSSNRYNTTIGARMGGSSLFMNGTVDDVKICGRVLSKNEVAATYRQSTPLSNSNFYLFSDLVTNNTMILNADRIAASNDSALLTCKRFFSEDKLAFESNCSLIVNLWTNLGQPQDITNGFYNQENSTITLFVNSTSSAETNWVLNTSPFSSNLSIDSTIAGQTTSFHALWNDTQGLLGGGYILSTNNSGQWTNMSWIPFSSVPSWTNFALVLNNNSGMVIGFKEYANNTVNMWNESEIYYISTMAPSSISTPSATTTISPSLQSTLKPSFVPSPSPPDSTVNPPSSPESNESTFFLLEAAILTISVVIGLFALFIFAVKNNFISLEVVHENKDNQEKREDYNI